MEKILEEFEKRKNNFKYHKNDMEFSKFIKN